VHRSSAVKALADAVSRYFTFLEECKEPKACTILLRGPSKDILNEVDRNLADAMAVARNVVFNPRLAPGGGATEMAISVGLNELARTIEGVAVGPIRAVADAMEVIPRTLIQNCGGNAIKLLTSLRAHHANGEHSMGVDGEGGKIVEMGAYGLYEPAAVKAQTLKTAIEVSRAMRRAPTTTLTHAIAERLAAASRRRCRVCTQATRRRRRRRAADAADARGCGGRRHAGHGLEQGAGTTQNHTGPPVIAQRERKRAALQPCAVSGSHGLPEEQQQERKQQAGEQQRDLRHASGHGLAAQEGVDSRRDDARASDDDGHTSAGLRAGAAEEEVLVRGVPVKPSQRVQLGVRGSVRTAR
jgi:hypothetical protein